MFAIALLSSILFVFAIFNGSEDER